MGRPTKEELEQAITKAISMRESGQDADYIAKSLLNHHYRLGKAEQVIDAIKHYIRSGSATIEHARLLKALENWDQVESELTERQSFGLE